MADTDRVAKLKAALKRAEDEEKAKTEAAGSIETNRAALKQLEGEEEKARKAYADARKKTVAWRAKVRGMEFLLGERHTAAYGRRTADEDEASPPETPDAATPEPGGGDNADQT